jgi:hypothetical protein
MEIIPTLEITTEKEFRNNLNMLKELGINKLFIYGCGFLYFSRIASEENFWVGVKPANDIRILDIIEYSDVSSINGIWYSAYENSANYNKDEIIADIFKAKQNKKNTIEIFGQINFNNYFNENELVNVSTYSARNMEVIIISDSDDGAFPPRIDMVNAIRNIIQNKHLAIYGGITLENIKEYSELASYIILKKEISNKDNKFDKNKLMEFINYVK